MTEASSAKIQEVKKVTIPVTGMSCAACANRVEKGLGKVEGVTGANVNFALENATVEFDPAQVDMAGLIQKIEDLGYGVKSGKTELGIGGMT